MDTKDIISSGILELYAAGLTSEKENREVAEWLVQYPELVVELAAIETSVEAYAQSRAAQPSPSVKDNIFNRINEGSQAKVLPLNQSPVQSGGVAPFWRVAAAASILLLVGSVVFNMLTYNKYVEAGKERDATRNSLAALEERNREIEAGMSVVQSKYSVPVALTGLAAAPDAAAKIFWMKNTGEVFVDASNLPDAPQGKQYQLWGIVDGKPVDGGMIITSGEGSKYRIQKMNSFGKAEAFAITLETEKGNPTPQGPMFVMGKM